jgi:hypothetical protein
MNDTQNISLYLKLIITIVLLFWTGVVPTTSLLQQVHAGSYSDKNSPAIRADFNGDGSDDLAVGVPGQNIGGIANAGAVNVIYGSSPGGLTAANNQIWHQDRQQNSIRIQGLSEANDQFGAALAAGDFNEDGSDDLAVGVPGENLIGVVAGPNDGAVNVIYGSSPSGLTAQQPFDTVPANQFWHQNSQQNNIHIQDTSEPGDQFGADLAAGDFNGDGSDDLAVGVPHEGIVVQGINRIWAGAVNVIYGSPFGLGSQPFGGAPANQFWHQNSQQNNIHIQDTIQEVDIFGKALAAGDFNEDGSDDLAVGVWQEGVTESDDGAVNVIYGSSPSGLTAANNQFWHQAILNTGGIPVIAWGFGQSLSAGDFNGDGSDDLAIGVPGGDIGGIANAGAVNVIYGSPLVGSSHGGLTTANNQFWHQNSQQNNIHIQGENSEDNWFGWG